MYIGPLKRLNTLNAVCLFSVAVSAAIVGVYFVFNFYLNSVSEELMGSWLQSEAVAIQEGNLLTSITKNQRVLLSSQFVKGVSLFDTSTAPAMRLIEVGERIEPQSLGVKASEEVQIVGAGFLKKQAVFRVPSKPELVLIFDVESLFLRRIFFATVAALLLFIIFLFVGIKAVQRREFLRREEFLKNALSDFIDKDKPSMVVERELPFLISWWKEKRAESERAKHLAIENESKILLGELAARVAHDIRSPLNTINALTIEMVDLPENTAKLMKSAIQRLRDIANGIGDQNRQILARENKTAGGAEIFQNASESIFMLSVLESILHEKQIEHQTRNLKFGFEASPSAHRAFSEINELEFRRALSNLIDNAVEASSKIISVLMDIHDDGVKIVIADNGKGIPADILNRIGEKGFSSSKEGGSGLGVYYAKQAVHSWRGQLKIASTVGKGTSIQITLPLTSPPDWFAERVLLPKGSTVIILDDDPTIHAVWQDRMRGIAQDLNIQHFFDPHSATSWFVQNRHGLGRFLFLSDYELRVDGANGLDVIERLGISQKDVLLVTNAFDDNEVRLRCAAMKIKILPKPSLAVTPVSGIG